MRGTGWSAVVLLGLAPLLGSCSRDAAAQEDETCTTYRCEVDDEEIARLAFQQRLNDLWNIWLRKMDVYNIERSSDNDEEFAEWMEDNLWASTFFFGMYDVDGEVSWGGEEYTPLSWIEANNVESWNVVKDTMIIVNDHHWMETVEPGKKVILYGYHQHKLLGDVAALYGESREIAFDTITFEKQDVGWRITHYREDWRTSTPLPSRPDGAPTGGHGPPGPRPPGP